MATNARVRPGVRKTVMAWQCRGTIGRDVDVLPRFYNNNRDSTPLTCLCSKRHGTANAFTH